MEQPGSKEPISSQAFYVFENPRAFMGMVTWAALNMDRDNTGALHLSMAPRRAFIEEFHITESVCYRLCCCTLQSCSFIPRNSQTQISADSSTRVQFLFSFQMKHMNHSKSSLSIVSGNCEEQTLKSI